MDTKKNYIVPKYFIKSIFEQYPDHCNQKFFVLITRAVGNLALKRIWTTFIKAETRELLSLQNFYKKMDEKEEK